MPPVAKLPDDVMGRVNLRDFIADLENYV
jgi:hypothetical protein